MAHLVTLIPGDGIGPEVAEAARRVLDSTGVDIEWDVQDAGEAMIEREGTPLPDRVLDAIRRSRVALKGPITTPVGTGFRSVNVTLRQELDLFAAVRPSRTWPGVPARYDHVDLVIMRENTEDLYAGIEFERGTGLTKRLCAEISLCGYSIRDDAGVTVKPISVTGTRRIVQFAFDYARSNRRRAITLGHKANIMRFSDGVFLETATEVARSYPDISFEPVQVDELALRLVSNPEELDVLVLPNLYGDIISDLCAGLVGGLGLAAGANIGWEYSLFEPVHGSAPDIAGKGVADPVATLLSGAMMLRRLSEHDAAGAVESAVEDVLSDGSHVTRDLGGNASTHEMTAALERAVAGRRVAV